MVAKKYKETKINNIEYMIFDRNAICSLQHNINHLKRSLHDVPKPIKTMKWECDIYKKEVCLEGSLNYIVDHLDAILKQIKLAKYGEIKHKSKAIVKEE